MLHAATAHLQRRLVWMFVALGFIGFTAFLLALRLPEVTEGLNPVPVILQRRRPARGNGAVPQPAPAVLLEPDDDLVVPFPAPAGEMAPEPEPATTTPDPAAAGTTQETIYDIDSVPHKTETVREGRRRMQKLPVQEGAIFVSISSYRDENCKQTLAQIFSKCKHCDRIHIGLVEQRDNSDTPCELGPEHAQYRGQMRVIRLHSSLARGPTYARYMTSRLWQGEQYFMQIDAHLNFIDRWDERLLNMVPHMPSKKFVISHYPVATVQELETPGNAVPFICDAKFDDYMQGLFSQDSSWYSKEQHGGRPQASPFIGAGFLFAPSSILWDAPFDRYLDFLFHGEEFVHAARLWTAGYELVVPLENICNHVYGHRKFNAYVDNPASSALAEEARIRVRYLLGMSSDKPAHMEEVDDLGLGHERTFDAYLEYTGVDWRNKRIDKRCDQQYDWDTRQWYLSDDVVPKGPRPYKRTVVNRIDTWPEFTEPAADFADRVRHAKVQPGAIFVSIGSYRDPLCDPTLLELFTKCDHCDRVYVGLVDQTMPGSNDRPCLGPEDRRQQISRVTLDARQSQGPTHARYIASKLYENEEYYLQIDSHLHFVDHWDTVLVDMIGSMPTKKAVVSTYPVVDTTPLDDANMWVPWICDASFHGPGGLITQAANSWYNRANPAIQAANADPGSTTFLGAGFMFGPATVLIDAPFDRYLPFLFHGEELLYAARLWTHNWDFFIPTRNVVSHLYYLRNYTVFQDNGDAFRVQKESEQRARYLMKLEGAMPVRAEELEDLGLGTERPIQDYWTFTGLDWNTNTVSNRCQQIYDYQNKKWLPRPAD